MNGHVPHIICVSTLLLIDQGTTYFKNKTSRLIYLKAMHLSTQTYILSQWYLQRWHRWFNYVRFLKSKGLFIKRRSHAFDHHDKLELSH